MLLMWMFAAATVLPELDGVSTLKKKDKKNVPQGRDVFAPSWLYVNTVEHRSFGLGVWCHSSTNTKLDVVADCDGCQQEP